MAANGEYRRKVLKLQHVLGHTPIQPNTLAFHSQSSRFAVCAGSVAIVNSVDSAFNVSQKHYCAGPEAAILGTGVDFEQTGVSPLNKRSRGFSSPKVPINCGTSFARDSRDSSSRPGSQVKPRSISCVAFSHDGRYLAVGEIGHAPRIILFSVGSDTDEKPLAVAAEHSYAVKHLTFSPDGRFLLSVGDLHDGFVCLWSAGLRSGSLRLHASSKCTSVINDIAWTGNTNIVTVGIRHIKVWRPEAPSSSTSSSPTKLKLRQDGRAGSLPSSPAPKGLSGRNALLGPLLEASFTTVQPISECNTIVGSDKGDICLLTITAGSHKLEKMFSTGESIRSLTLFGDEYFGVICQSGVFWVATCADLSDYRGDNPWKQSELKLDHNVVVVASLHNSLLAVDSQGTTYLYEINNSNQMLGNLRSKIPSHSAAIVGLSIIRDPAEEMAFITYDSVGYVMFWTSSGEYRKSGHVAIDHLQPTNETDSNELKVFQSFSGATCFAAGDKYGYLSLIKRDFELSYFIRAHQSEINDVAFRDVGKNGRIWASAGRDRMIQVFLEFEQKLKLIQTIDQHASSVNQLSFLEEKDVLLSLSSDRTIVFNSMANDGNSIAFIPLRTLTFRQSPLSMAVIPGKPVQLAVITSDRQLHRYQCGNAQLEEAAKLLDKYLPVTIDQMVPITARSKDEEAEEGVQKVYDALVGVSSTDKSIRVQDLDSGLTLAKAYGHSESISGVCVLEGQFSNDSTKTIITCSRDGSIMLWQLSTIQAPRHDTVASNPVSAPNTPLRKVLSKSLLADMAASLDISSLSATPTRGRSPTRPMRRPSRQTLSNSPPKRATFMRERQELLPLESPFSSFSQGQMQSSSEREDTPKKPTTSHHSLENLIHSLQGFRDELSNHIELLAHEDLTRVRSELWRTLEAVGQRPNT